ncbi:hypothetical protein ACH5RR_005546 [Cinchona calisaya]|uniref:Uncharacterized protein n=1 Tax=Cinchona calisaya TaxID=153742 RepID=A0ABD3ALF3_9GENT
MAFYSVQQNPNKPQYGGGLVVNQKFKRGVKAWLQVSNGSANIAAVVKTSTCSHYAGWCMGRSGCWSMLKGGLTVNRDLTHQSSKITQHWRRRTASAWRLLLLLLLTSEICWLLLPAHDCLLQTKTSSMGDNTNATTASSCPDLSSSSNPSGPSQSSSKVDKGKAAIPSLAPKDSKEVVFLIPFAAL